MNDFIDVFYMNNFQKILLARSNLLSTGLIFLYNFNFSYIISFGYSEIALLDLILFVLVGDSDESKI